MPTPLSDPMASISVEEAVSTPNAASECAPKTKMKKAAFMQLETTKTAR